MLVWSLWHFQTDTDRWGMEDDEQPHLLIGYFVRREQAEEVRVRLLSGPGFGAWPRGFRVGREPLDGATGSEQGFIDPWDDDAPSADPTDVLRLADPTPRAVPTVIWSVRHSKRCNAAAPPEPQNEKGVGVFSSVANAEAAVAHRRRQPGFCDWPQGFRVWRRRLGAAIARMSA